MKNKYEVRGDVVSIFVRYKDEVHECLIDIDDLDKAKSVDGTWLALKHHTGRYYVRVAMNKKKVLLHRFLMRPEKSMVVDHINHEPLDNRKGNLRIVTPAQNRQNLSGAKPNSGTGIRGVTLDKSTGNYRTKVYVNNKAICIGAFEDILDAEMAVKQARAKYMPYSQEAL